MLASEGHRDPVIRFEEWPGGRWAYRVFVGGVLHGWFSADDCAAERARSLTT